MDHIEFIISECNLGVGPSVCIEPMINGQRLDEILQPPDRDTSGYAGLPPETLYRALRENGPTGEVQLLRCSCGDDCCSWAVAQVIIGPHEVLWKQFRASHTDASVCAGVGPLRFDRGQFETALAKPTLVYGCVRNPWI